MFKVDEYLYVDDGDCPRGLRLIKFCHDVAVICAQCGSVTSAKFACTSVCVRLQIETEMEDKFRLRVT